MNFGAGTKNVFVTYPAGRSAYAATVPSNGQLLIGNGTNFTLSTLTGGGGISIVNGAGTITISSGGVITENQRTISSNYTVTDGYNGLSVGPVTINTSVAVTVGTGEKWMIL